VLIPSAGTAMCLASCWARHRRTSVRVSWSKPGFQLLDREHIVKWHWKKRVSPLATYLRRSGVARACCGSGIAGKKLCHAMRFARRSTIASRMTAARAPGSAVSPIASDLEPHALLTISRPFSTLQLAVHCLPPC
jgi:hypothetical protein